MLYDSKDSTAQKQGSQKVIEGHAMLTHDRLNERFLSNFELKSIGSGHGFQELELIFLKDSPCRKGKAVEDIITAQGMDE